MPYNTSDAVPRTDISTVLMEAVGQEGLYIGQMVLPIYPTPTEVGRYPKFKKKESELLRSGKGYAGSTKRGSTGTYNEVERSFAWDSFQTEEFGLEERVDDTVARRMQNFFDAEMITSKLIMNMMMLDYESEVAAVIMNAGNFTATAAAVAYTEANIATVDVPRDMNAIIERLTLKGELPEDCIMSLRVWNYIRRSQKMQTYVYGFLNVTQGGSQITPEMFAAAFGLKRMMIAKKSVDIAQKGLTSSLVPIWGNDYIAVGRFSEGDFQNGGVGRTIIWEADAPGGLWTSESYRDEKRRGNIIRIRSNRILKIVNSEALELITTSFA